MYPNTSNDTIALSNSRQQDSRYSSSVNPFFYVLLHLRLSTSFHCATVRCVCVRVWHGRSSESQSFPCEIKPNIVRNLFWLTPTSIKPKAHCDLNPKLSGLLMYSTIQSLRAHRFFLFFIFYSCVFRAVNSALNFLIGRV